MVTIHILRYGMKLKKKEKKNILVEPPGSLSAILGIFTELLLGSGLKGLNIWSLDSL